MYDCYNIPDCLPPNNTHTHTGALHVGAKVGDPPHVGVARPANSSDQNLTIWEKDPHNPIYFPGMGGGFAGPSNLWATTSGQSNTDGEAGNATATTTTTTTTYNMVMALGRSMARFQSTDPTLHN